jgi:hypothetical protein
MFFSSSFLSVFTDFLLLHVTYEKKIAKKAFHVFPQKNGRGGSGFQNFPQFSDFKIIQTSLYGHEAPQPCVFKGSKNRSRSSVEYPTLPLNTL